MNGVKEEEDLCFCMLLLDWLYKKKWNDKNNEDRISRVMASDYWYKTQFNVSDSQDKQSRQTEIFLNACKYNGAFKYKVKIRNREKKAKNDDTEVKT